MKFVFKASVMAFALVLALIIAPEGAQEYPTRPIQLVIPYTAGGGTVSLAGLVAEGLSARLGQRVVPESRPGAGTALATGLVAKSSPDGYTLLFSTLTHSLNATMYSGLPFDPVNDFSFIKKVGTIGLLVVTNYQSKIIDLGALVNLMRSQPGTLQFGSAGVGTPMHIGGKLLLKQVTTNDAMHVPYKGESAALADLLGWHVSFMLCSVTTCTPRAKDGSLKALAITATDRSALAPAVPTVGEAGFAGAVVNTWFFRAAQKGTPTAVVAKLSLALNEILADGSFNARTMAMGVEVERQTTLAATKALVQTQIEKWRPIIKATGAANRPA